MALVYASPDFSPGTHTLTLAGNRNKRALMQVDHYVSVDGGASITERRSKSRRILPYPSSEMQSGRKSGVRGNDGNACSRWCADSDKLQQTWVVDLGNVIK